MTHVLDIILDLPLAGRFACKTEIEKRLVSGPQMYYILQHLGLSHEVAQEVRNNLTMTPREFFNLTIEERLEWAQRVAPSVDAVRLTKSIEHAVRSFVGRAVENYWHSVNHLKRE